MSKAPVTPSITPRVQGHAYFAASARVLSQVVNLVQARGAAVSVDVDPGRLPSQAIIDTHHIKLTYGHSIRTIEVDHDTFMSPEFFKTLVLHQVEAAIEDLAGQTKFERRAQCWRDAG